MVIVYSSEKRKGTMKFNLMINKFIMLNAFFVTDKNSGGRVIKNTNV